MSDAQDDQPSKLNSVAILPWTVALVLFLALLGVLTVLGMGLTSDPPSDPAAEPAMTEASEADPAEQPDAARSPEPQEDPAAETAPEQKPDVEPEMPSDAARDAARETAMAPEPDDVRADAIDGASSTGAADPVIESAEPSLPAPAEETMAAAPPPPDATTPPETTPSDTTPSEATPPAATPAPALPRRTASALPPAPDPGLIEASPLGPLPRIGPDGREPWKVYARPFDAGDDRPRVAIVLSGLGLSSAATEAAIQGLPSEVTLAYQPFADNIQQWIRLSRAAGHEVLLNLPMEPVDIRSNDPGPRALFVSFTPEENLDRMRWALSRVTGYVGVVNHMGSRFTVSREAMQPVLTELKARGLLFLDARSAARSVATSLASEMQVPRAINDRFLDNREVSRVTVDARLAEVESIAREAGVSIAIGQAFPVTIERIRAWAETLDEKGIALVPISAVVDRQSDR